MPMTYTAPATASVSTAVDVFELVCPADSVILVHEITITQQASETSEQLPFTLAKASGSYTSGSGGSSPTKTPKEKGFPASGATLTAFNTTRASAGTGTLTVVNRKDENIINGITWLFTPECYEWLSPGDAFIVGLEATPGATLTMSATIQWSEFGG